MGRSIRKGLQYSFNKALKSRREQNTSRPCLTRFKDSKWSPWIVKHSSISLEFKVRPHGSVAWAPHPWMALSMMRTWAKICLHISARDRFHYFSGYTPEKLCHPHPGRGGPAYWTRGIHLIDPRSDTGKENAGEWRPGPALPSGHVQRLERKEGGGRPDG